MNRGSKESRVQSFLDEIEFLDDGKFKILQNLRQIVFDNSRKVKEKLKYGGIMFYLEGDFGGIFVSKNHISFEFTSGYTLKDPKKLLEGTGKFRRHLEIRSFLDIKHKEVDLFVKKAIKNTI